MISKQPININRCNRFVNLTVNVLSVSCCFDISEAGMLAKKYIEKGLLVPDHVMTRLLLPRLEEIARHSWLLDGRSGVVKPL